MLVLSRKTDQAIHIGSDIIVRVSAVAGNRVKLAIEAPREVAIRRSELVEQTESRDDVAREDSVSGEIELANLGIDLPAGQYLHVG